ncbi:hypothetical protein D1007_32008 [Hordeum vulgare]|nr:hypothetical protein D1007_32008 [Hordeum vulgare]
MVYEDESSNDLSSLDISSSFDDMMYRIPASIDDEYYMGIENSPLDVRSEHGLPPERRVALEGFETGTRFLVCAQPPPQNCGFVGWTDQEWPPTMQNALLKLWEMLEDNKSGRRDDNLENSLKIHHLREEKRNLDANYDKLVEDVNQLLNAQEERVMDLSYMNVNAHGGESSSSAISSRQGHLKEKEKLSEENYNLKVQVDKLTKFEEKLIDDIVVLNLHIDGLKKGIENLIKRRDELKLQIADQLKALEKNQEKLKMIRDILDG